MTPTLFPCYAPADRPAASAIADYIARGMDVRIFLDEGEMRPDETLAHKAREGRVADIVLVLFSRQSLPSRWPRSEWEGALLTEPANEGVRIGFVRLDDCIPPRVLVPAFELGGLPLRGMRSLKRWVRNRAAEVPAPAVPTELEVLGIAIADRPGTETVAHSLTAGEFAEAFREDFDAVLRLYCGHRSLAALTGDLAAQLGLRLEGDVESNLDRLGEFCASRRFLIVLEDAADAAPQLVFGGRSSTLVSTEPLEPEIEAGTLAAVQHALASGGGSWSEFCALARQGRRLAQEQGRIAECYELMEQWHAAAEARQDRTAMDESARERVWILESWGRTDEAARLEYRRAVEWDEQMMLPFG